MCPVVAVSSPLLQPPMTVNAHVTLDITHILEMRSAGTERQNKIRRREGVEMRRRRRMRRKKDQTDYFSDSGRVKMRGRTGVERNKEGRLNETVETPMGETGRRGWVKNAQGMEDEGSHTL